MTGPPELAYPRPVCAFFGAGTHGFWWAPRTSNPLSGISVSEVGSIPTRSRHFSFGSGRLAALILILVSSTVAPDGPAAAATGAGGDSTSVGRAEGFAAPFWVMMRSVAVPGWGQAHNGHWLKAAVLGGAEAAFVYGAVEENRLSSIAARNGDEAGADAHRGRKKDYIWWGAFTLLLSAGDAYVDAHLSGFDAEFREEDSAVVLSYSFEVAP